MTSVPIAGIEPVLQVENCPITIAEIFAAFHAPATAVKVAALHLIGAMPARVTGEVKALVDQSIERDAALRMGCAGEQQRGDK